MQGVNLIPVHRRAMAILARRLRLWITLAAACAALLTVVVLGFRTRQPASPAVSVRAVADARRRGEGLKLEIAKKNAALADARVRLAARQVLSNRPDWSLLLVAVSRLLGPDNVLRDFKLEAFSPPAPAAPAAVKTAKSGSKAAPLAAAPATPTRFRLGLSGIGRSQAAVSDFALRLEGIALFDHVKIVRSAREPFLHGDAIAFSVECTLGERGRP
jgi:Tfp pilus assembly protein PilN